MRAFAFGLALLAVVATADAQVTPEEHAAHHPDQASSAPAAKAAPAPSAMSQTPADAQLKMKAMQALMDKLTRTKDPAERARLLAQHREAMRQQLDAMKQMECGMDMSMMGKGGGEKMAAGMSDKATPDAAGKMGQGGMMGGDMMKCHEMTQARMDMMIGMMDQMMKHEDAAHSAR